MIEIPDWLADLLANTSALQLIFWIGAIAALIAVLVKLWPALTKMVTIINAVSGLPAFITRTDQTLQTQNQALAGQDTKISEIHHEVHFNNGSSVKDAVIRVETGVAGLYGEVAKLNTADEDLRADFEKTHPKNPLKE